MKKLDKYIQEKLVIDKNAISSTKQLMDNFLNDLNELIIKEFGHKDNEFKIKQIDKTGCSVELLYHSLQKDFNTFKYLLEESIKNFKYIDKVDFGSKDRRLIYIKCEFK